MARAPGSSTIEVGYSDGAVYQIDLVSWRSTPVLQAKDSIREIAFTPDGSIMGVASFTDAIHVRTSSIIQTPQRETWTNLRARAREIALTSDGLLVAACTDGMIWLFDTAHNRSLCIQTGVNSLTLVTPAANEQIASIFDTEGRVIIVDLDAARAQLRASYQD